MQVLRGEARPTRLGPESERVHLAALGGAARAVGQMAAWLASHDAVAAAAALQAAVPRVCARYPSRHPAAAHSSWHSVDAATAAAVAVTAALGLCAQQCQILAEAQSYEDSVKCLLVLVAAARPSHVRMSAAIALVCAASGGGLDGPEVILGGGPPHTIGKIDSVVLALCGVARRRSSRRILDRLDDVMRGPRRSL